jgi:hypothetical protein
VGRLSGWAWAIMHLLPSYSAAGPASPASARTAASAGSLP